MANPQTVTEILNEQTIPAVAIDNQGLFTWLNQAFTTTYGWAESDLLGKSVTTIMPPAFRDAHHVGFSRFISTEKATVAGKPLPLAILFKDGTIKNAEHFILAEKKDGQWRFAATIRLR